jgi:hypothetical protein
MIALLLRFTPNLSDAEQANDELARARDYVSYVWNTFPADDPE